MRCDEGARCVVDDGCDLDRDVVLLQRATEDLPDVIPFDVWITEPFGPADENGVVDSFLRTWVRELALSIRNDPRGRSADVQ